MALNPTVTVTLAHPLSASHAAALGITPEQEYPQGTTFTVSNDAAARLIRSGMTTISPTDFAAIAALLGTDVPVDRAVEVPVFVGSAAPVNPPARYMWFQTGLGPDGTGMTVWIEDGLT